MASSVPLRLFCGLHGLADDAADGVGGVTLHPRRSVGVGAEGKLTAELLFFCLWLTRCGEVELGCFESLPAIRRGASDSRFRCAFVCIAARPSHSPVFCAGSP